MTGAEKRLQAAVTQLTRARISVHELVEFEIELDEAKRALVTERIGFSREFAFLMYVLFAVVAIMSVFGFFAPSFEYLLQTTRGVFTFCLGVPLYCLACATLTAYSFTKLEKRYNEARVVVENETSALFLQIQQRRIV